MTQRIQIRPGQSLDNTVRFLEHQAKQYKDGIMIEVKPFFPPRTHSQNAYFHGVVVPAIAVEKAVPVHTVKESLKQAFLPPWESVVNAGDYVVRPTSGLSREEFSEFIEQCVAWAAEQGIYIPDPQ